VGVMAFWLRKYRYLDDTILSVSIGTFMLTLVSELVTGLQYLLQVATSQSVAASMDSLSYLWIDRAPIIALAAILSGLWMPILYYPLSLWWQKFSAS
jgi:hypothetical protein